MTAEELQKQHEAAVADLIAKLAGRGTDSDWALARALVHRAVHLVAERKSAEFCAVATLLAEMVGHAHALMHPADAAGAAASGVVH